MTKGYLSHLCYCNGNFYSKHIVYTDKFNQFVDIIAFTYETAQTIFCDGIMLVVSEQFEEIIDTFTTSLLQQLKADKTLSIVEAMTQNDILRQHYVSKDCKCALYTITGIDWENKRPCDIETLGIERVSEL